MRHGAGTARGPAIGTAGFERVAVKGNNRVPAPPPSMTDNISLLIDFSVEVGNFWLEIYSFVIMLSN